MSAWMDKGRVRLKCGKCQFRVEATRPWNKKRVFRCDHEERGIGIRVGKDSRCYHAIGVQYESNPPKENTDGS